MAWMREKSNYFQISNSEKLKLYFFSVCAGIWYLLRKAFTMLWKSPQKINKIPQKPLHCLVDNSYGTHWYIKLKKTKFHYVEAGKEGSPLIILLHGFPDCWLGWRNQIKFLSTHFRVIAFDLKGFGDSEKPLARSEYDVKNLVNEIHILTSGFSSSNTLPTIMGHGIGAHLAWYYVSMYPDSVSQFVAISCPHPNVLWNYLPTSSFFSPNWIQFCQLPVLPEVEASSNNLSILNNFYCHLKASEKKLIDAYKYLFSRRKDWTGPLNYYRNLPFYRLQIRKNVKLKVPTLLIIGNHDPFTSLESMVASTEFVSKHVLKVVENAGHFPHQENPDFVNSLLEKFLTVCEKKPEPSKLPKDMVESFLNAAKKYKIGLVGSN